MCRQNMQIPVTTSGRIHPYHPNMRPRLFPPGAIFLLATVVAVAQETSVLTNDGKPLRVPYGCAQEDLQFAGLSCDRSTDCPIYLELSSVAANGSGILVAGNLHSDSATLDSILLESADAGATWKEPAARIRGDAIEQLQWYDSQHAWAAGETQYPLPRDPFVLSTTDGGASWKEHPVGEDGSAGSIQRFGFDTAAHGEVVIDSGKATRDGRYVVYESETGGESWKQSGAGDKLPSLNQAPAAIGDSDWRVRPSSDGKSWQIEKRMGDAWSPVASFLIEVAGCSEPAQPKAPVP